MSRHGGNTHRQGGSRQGQEQSGESANGGRCRQGQEQTRADADGCRHGQVQAKAGTTKAGEAGAGRSRCGRAYPPSACIPVLDVPDRCGRQAQDPDCIPPKTAQGGRNILTATRFRRAAPIPAGWALRPGPHTAASGPEAVRAEKATNTPAGATDPHPEN